MSRPVMTAEQHNARLARLPVWAQDSIRDLTRRVEELNHRLEDLTSEHPDTNVKMSGGYVYPDITLPLNSEVAFKLTDDEYDYIRVRHDLQHNGFLHLMGSGQLVVRSVCSNVVEVGVYGRN